jgi:hypothetical protein
MHGCWDCCPDGGRPGSSCSLDAIPFSKDPSAPRPHGRSSPLHTAPRRAGIPAPRTRTFGARICRPKRRPGRREHGASWREIAGDSRSARQHQGRLCSPARGRPICFDNACNTECHVPGHTSVRSCRVWVLLTPSEMRHISSQLLYSDTFLTYTDLTSRWELLIKNDQDISSPPRTSPPRKSLSPSIPSSPFLAVFNKPVSPITSEVADDVSDKEAELANRMKGNARVLGVLTDGNEVATTGQQVQTEVRVDLALPSFEPFQPIYKPDVVADLELHLSQKAQSDSQPQSHNHQAQNDGGNVPQAPDNHFQLNPVEFTNISSIQGLQLEATERVSKSVILLPSATLASSTPHCSQSQPLETSLGFVSEAAESKATVVPSGYQTPAGRSMPIVCAQAVHTSSKILRDASCQTEISSSMTTGQNLLRLSSSNDTGLFSMSLLHLHVLCDKTL